MTGMKRSSQHMWHTISIYSGAPHVCRRGQIAQLKSMPLLEAAPQMVKKHVYKLLKLIHPQHPQPYSQQYLKAWKVGVGT